MIVGQSRAKHGPSYNEVCTRIHTGTHDTHSTTTMTTMRRAVTVASSLEPAVLQIEHHPYLVQQPMLDLTVTPGISVTTYSSYGPQTWLELNMHHSVPSLFENDVITSIAKRHGKSASVNKSIHLC